MRSDGFGRKRAREKHRVFRSYTWLEAHDTSTIDELLVSALTGKNKKSQLVTVGTLLAVADAIIERTRQAERAIPPAEESHEHTFAPAKASSRRVNRATYGRLPPRVQALALELAERFVPLLTSIALGGDDNVTTNIKSGGMASFDHETVGKEAPSTQQSGGLRRSGLDSSTSVVMVDASEAQTGKPTHAADSEARLAEKLEANGTISNGSLADAAPVTTGVVVAPQKPLATLKAPTALTGFAAECALSWIRITAVMVVTGPETSQTDSGETHGNEGLSSSPTDVRGSSTGGPLVIGLKTAVGTMPGPTEKFSFRARRAVGVDTAQMRTYSDHGVLDVERPYAKGNTEASPKPAGKDEDDVGRRDALRIMHVLAPSCTLPLLSLAIGWVGAPADPVSHRAGVNQSHCGYRLGDGYTDENRTSFITQNYRGRTHACSSDGWFSNKFAHTNKSLRGREPGKRTQCFGRLSLGARAVCDLRDLLSSSSETLQQMEDLLAERRRVRVRDGKSEEVERNRDGVDVNKRMHIEEQEFLQDMEALLEHASWHLVGTVPAILENRLWPTTGLKLRGSTMTSVGRGGRKERIGLVREAAAEIEACNPRTYEMAGSKHDPFPKTMRNLTLWPTQPAHKTIATLRTLCMTTSDTRDHRDERKPPDGLEEPQWLALRKLCLYLSGLKGKDLQAKASRYPPGEASGTAEEDPVSLVQRALIPALKCTKPEGQKLAASALAWLLSRLLSVGQRSRKDGNESSTVSEVILSPLFMLLEQDDAAGLAAAEILTEMVLEHPLGAVPEVLRAAREAASTTVSSVDRERFSRLHFTAILADVLRGVCLGLSREGIGDQTFWRETAVTEDIASLLLDRLCNSDDAKTRRTASDGLMEMDPSWLVPRLCQQLRKLHDGSAKQTVASVHEPGSSGERIGDGEDQAGGAIAGPAWGPSTASSAVFQLLGDLIVHGRDPPDTLSALVDTLRHPVNRGDNASFGGNLAAIGPARHAALCAKLIAEGSLRGPGDDDTRDGHGLGEQFLQDRVFLHMPLWAGRLRHRSDTILKFSIPEEGESADTITSVRQSRLSSTLMGDCLELAAIKALAAPGNPLLVRFFAVLAAATATSTNEQLKTSGVNGFPARSEGVYDEGMAIGEVAGALVGGVVEILRDRMRGQMRLTEAILNDETQEAAETVRALLFSRLTPLLLLKTLPASALVSEDVASSAPLDEDNIQRGATPLEPEKREGFDSDSEADVDGIHRCLNDMHGLLLERCSRVYEYDQVTRLSAEVCGKLPARLVFPDAISRLNGFAKSVEGATGTISEESDGKYTEVSPNLEEAEKSGDDVLASPATLASRSLFTACHAVTNHGHLIEPWLHSLLSVITRLLLLPAAEDGDVARVQEGGIECIAILLETAASNATTSFPNPANIPLVVPTIDSISTSTTLYDTSETNGARSDSRLRLPDVADFVTTLAVKGMIPVNMTESWSEVALLGELRQESNAAGLSIEKGLDAGTELRNGLPAPSQVRICAANAAVTAARRCAEEFLPALCNRGKFLDIFLHGASRGNGSLRAACLQAVFAMVYRYKGVFDDGGDTATAAGSTRSSCTRDDVMNVACDALDRGQDEVRLSGLKLIMGVAASGASSSSPASSRTQSLSSSKDESDGQSLPVDTRSLADSSETKRDTPLSLRRKLEGARDILSPAVASRTKRLLSGVSNMDESLEARKLAAQALQALGPIL